MVDMDLLTVDAIEGLLSLIPPKTYETDLAVCLYIYIYIYISTCI